MQSIGDICVCNLIAILTLEQSSYWPILTNIDQNLVNSGQSWSKLVKTWPPPWSNPGQLRSILVNIGLRPSWPKLTNIDQQLTNSILQLQSNYIHRYRRYFTLKSRFRGTAFLTKNWPKLTKYWPKLGQYSVNIWSILVNGPELVLDQFDQICSKFGQIWQFIITFEHYFIFSTRAF